MNNEKINPVTTGLIIAQVIFTILMIISFNMVLANEPIDLGVEVGGINQEIEGLPESGKSNIEYNIYQAVADNTASGDIKKTGVVLRAGSLINKYYEEFNINYVNFIADVPDVEQSYRVIYEWSDDAENEYLSPAYSTIVMCVEPDEVIFENFDCNTEDDYMKNTVVSSMAYRYGYALPGYDNISILPEGLTGGEDFRMRINYVTCDTQCSCKSVSKEEQQVAIRAFSDFVAGLGFEPGSISYHFDNCGE